MQIKLHEIYIKDLVKDYKNKEEEGVTGYSGLLNIRPKYQREFVYKDSQRDAVIETVLKGFPLNVMYWVKKENTSDEFEVLDGQQRTMSICEYAKGNFSIEVNGNPMGFHNLTQEDRDKILNYELMVYFCEGSDKEKLEWFRTINIAGEELTEQELRNAVYTGSWLSDAKKHFSKTGCAGYNIGNRYLVGTPIRQEYLETALEWINDGKIEDYMSTHQNDKDAIELWNYFTDVINWIKKLFPENNYRKEMKGLNWGILYNKYKDIPFNSNDLEEKIKKLILDDEVSNKKGIYSYLITGDLKYLSLRNFSESQKREVYEKQEGICISCVKNNNSKVNYEIEEMEADHIIPWHDGGKTNVDNCQMLCKQCNRRKSGK